MKFAPVPALESAAELKKSPPRSANYRGHGHEGNSFMSLDRVEPGFCECGCGAYIGFWDRNIPSRGIKRGDPRRFVHNHHGRRDPAQQFWSKIDKENESGCWIWTGARSHGYGDFSVGRRVIRAHRFSYEMLVGPIPEGLEIDHLCKRRECVNPDHLEPVTSRENNLRRDYAGTETHCPHGHLLAGYNLMFNKRTGARICRTCHVEANRRYRARKRAGL